MLAQTDRKGTSFDVKAFEKGPGKTFCKKFSPKITLFFLFRHLFLLDLVVDHMTGGELIVDIFE